MSGITLITGGARSGKSSHALALAMQYEKRAFIATAEPIDAEMEARISAHREERGDGFKTIEESTDLAGAISGLSDDTEVVIVDCLTVWLGNLLHLHGPSDSEYAEVSDLLAMLPDASFELIMVTNEVGMGIVPNEAYTRSFRDSAGPLNAAVGRVASNVTLLVSGIPIAIKEPKGE